MTRWFKPFAAPVIGSRRATSRTALKGLMDFSKFESAWKDAGGWAVLILSPTQLPASVDKTRWLKIANELSRSGQEQAGAIAIQTLESHR